MKELLPALQRVANEVNSKDNTVLVLKDLTRMYNEIGEKKNTLNKVKESEEMER